MKFLFLVGDRLFSVNGDVATARRKFNSLTVNVTGDFITPRSLSLTTKDRLELQEARSRNPSDLFNAVTGGIDAVIDDVPVTNALPLPQLFADAPDKPVDYSGAGLGFKSFATPQQSVDLTPLGLPQMYPTLPGSAPQQFVQAGVQRPQGIDLSILSKGWSDEA